MRVVGGGERRKKRNGAESSKDDVAMEGQKDVSGGEVEDEGPADWMAKAKNRRDQAHKSKSWRQRGDGEIRAATATVKRRKSWNRGRLLTEIQAGRQQQHTPEQDRQGRSSSGDANRQPTSTHTSDHSSSSSTPSICLHTTHWLAIKQEHKVKRLAMSAILLACLSVTGSAARMIHRAELFCNVKATDKDVCSRNLGSAKEAEGEKERAFSEIPREYGLRETQLAQQRAIPDAKEAVSRLSAQSIQFILWRVKKRGESVTPRHLALWSQFEQNDCLKPTRWMAMDGDGWSFALVPCRNNLADKQCRERLAVWYPYIRLSNGFQVQ